MRQEKFDNTKSGFESDDIKYAFENNGLADKLDIIDIIVAEVCGANDEDSWYWIMKMKDGTFAWAKGSCDYTGWDCRSSADFYSGFPTSFEAWEAVKLSEYEKRQGIKKSLFLQLTEESPFALL